MAATAVARAAIKLCYYSACVRILVRAVVRTCVPACACVRVSSVCWCMCAWAPAGAFFFHRNIECTRVEDVVGTCTPTLIPRAQVFRARPGGFRQHGFGGGG